jgi:hypothetical protein
MTVEYGVLKEYKFNSTDTINKRLDISMYQLPILLTFQSIIPPYLVTVATQLVFAPG